VHEIIELISGFWDESESGQTALFFSFFSCFVVVGVIVGVIMRLKMVDP
jgi:hypothetical protein